MSILNQVVSGKRRKPVAVMIVAPKGLGKSSWASEAEGVIFVGPEENDELTAARFPQVKTWQQFKDQLKAIRDDKHDYKSLAVDSWDMLEGIAEKVICSGKDAKKNMATAMGGYGTAYKELAKMFREIRDEYLIPIRDKRGMNIIIVNHAEKAKFEDPITVTSYDKYFTASHDRVKPVAEDWVSAVLFLTFELFRAETSSGKEYAEGEGERVIYTEERPSQTAKNRFNLPYEMPYELGKGWSIFISHVNKFYGNAKSATHMESTKTAPKQTSVKTTEVKEAKNLDLEKEYEELLSKMPDTAVGSITAALKRAKGEPKEIERIINKMKSMID